MKLTRERLKQIIKEELEEMKIDEVGRVKVKLQTNPEDKIAMSAGMYGVVEYKGQKYGWWRNQSKQNFKLTHFSLVEKLSMTGGMITPSIRQQMQDLEAQGITPEINFSASTIPDELKSTLLKK